MSRTVTGTLLLPNGQPMANARIFFTAKRTEAVSIVEGVNAFFDTDSDGDYSQVIVDGWYSVSIEWQADAAGATVRRWQLGNAVVAAGASTTLEALIIASNPAASVEATLLYEVLEQAQQARDEAEAAADAAAASAATISPTKRAQWDQAFTERNRWDGGSSGLNAIAGRASLGLGTAAQANITGYPTDTSLGSVMKVRDGGLLGPVAMSPDTDLNNAGNFTYFFSPSSTSGVTNLPPGWDDLDYVHGINTYYSSAIGAQLVFGRSEGMAFRQRNGTNTYGAWRTVWDTARLEKITSNFDSTSGRVAVVGFMNLGVTAPSRSADFASMPMLTHFNWPNSSTDPNAPGATTFATLRMTVNSTVGVDLAARDSGTPAGFYWRGIEGGISTVWRKVWDTGNTSSNVQAMLSSANNAAIRTSISASLLPPYALSTVPSAAANTNLLILITDLTGGREPCFSDGTNWLRCSDKTIAN